MDIWDLGARLTIGHASVARMRDTPATAATAAENSTAASLHRTELHSPGSRCAYLLLVIVLSSLCLYAGAGAWMLECSDGSYDVYGITRLPHVLQVAQASRYWITESDREQPFALQTRPRRLGLHSRWKGNEVRTQARREGCVHTCRSAYQPTQY